MNKIRDEIRKSIKYIIPVIIAFICVLIVKNYSNICKFIINNISIIKNTLLPFFIGFVIAYILNQPMKFLENKFKMKRWLSITLVYGTIIVIIVFAWLFIVPVIESNIREILSYMPKGFKQIEDFINTLFSHFKVSEASKDAKLQIKEFLTNSLIPFSTTSANFIKNLLVNSISTIVSYTFNIVLGIFVSMYLLASKETYLRVSNILGQKIFKRHYLKVKEFINILDKNIGTYIVAKSIDSMVYASVCTIFLYLIKAKYALLLGIIICVTNMVPFFGPMIGIAVSVVTNLLFSVKKAILVFIIVMIIQQIESTFIDPYFVGKQVGVPPIFSILAVSVASCYFGVFGIVLSVPITSVILIYFRRFVYKDVKRL